MISTRHTSVLINGSPLFRLLERDFGFCSTSALFPPFPTSTGTFPRSRLNWSTSTIRQQNRAAQISWQGN